MSKLHFYKLFVCLLLLVCHKPIIAKSELSGLQISISNYTANPSESFCLDVTVSDFIQIVSKQYSIQWDASVLQLDNIIDINLPHPNNMLFNTTQAGMGLITALWFDSEGDGNDLVDGTVIYRMCFTAIGPAGSQTAISFENEPVNIEITDIPSGGANIGMMSESGLVSIVGAMSILNSSLEFTDCENPEGGAIDLTVIGGQAPLSFSWTGPGTFSADTEDINNLVSGNYFVTITDASDPPLILMDSFFINGDFLAPLAAAEAPDVYTCVDTLLILEGNNNSPGVGFQYLWLTTNGNIIQGNTTLNPTVNAPGVYELIITDTSNGCSSSAFAEVMVDTLPPQAEAGQGGQINCDDLTAILNGTTSTSGNGFSASWTTVGGSILTGENTYIATANAPGTYTITVVNGNNGCRATDQVLVTIDTISPIAEAGADQVQTCFDAVLSLDGSGTSIGAVFTYLWTSVDGNFTVGETSLNPQVNQPGSYELMVTNEVNGCTAVSMVDVSLDPALVEADAGEDEQLCEPSWLLMADLPAQNFGQWSAVGSAIFETPDENISEVNTLQMGLNQLIWTLSTDDCPNYDADTLELFVEGSPVAFDDDFEFPFGSTSFDLDFVQNDDLGQASDWQLAILEMPATGNILDQGNGVFEYSGPANFSGLISLTYELCNNFCPELCDTAMVRVLIEEEMRLDTMVDIPNSFTPNGDGINDTFVFTDLENNPELFPNNEFIVFNRWGDVVYRAQPYNNDWNGENQSGQNLPGGTYYYVMKLDLSNGEIIQGDVTILK